MSFWDMLPISKEIRKKEERVKQLMDDIDALRKGFIEMQLQYKEIKDEYQRLDDGYDDYVSRIETQKQLLRKEKQALKDKLQRDCDDLKKQREELRVSYNTELEQKQEKLRQECADLIKKKDYLADNYAVELEETRQRIEKELENEHWELKARIARDKEEVIEWDDRVLLQSFALYKPKYPMSYSLEYEDLLNAVRERQKQMIRNDAACICSTTWTINNSRTAGDKLIRDTKKLLLRSFNLECDDIVGKVSYSNHESCLKRMEKSYETINKLGKVHAIYINSDYLQLKREEMYLALEYAQKKKEERDRQRELRAEERENLRIKKELEAERDKVRKEKSHYENALEAARQQIRDMAEEEKQELLERIRELENHLQEVNDHLKDVDYREANQRAGYVYIISNIGSFGDDVYKIGMTRRLDPMERINELGSASVPFNFDVHAMIFTDDAPKLEAALHRAFEDKKVNMVNTRREFFRCSLEEIKKVVKENYDGTAEFYETADAEQYRESLRMREQIKNEMDNIESDNLWRR
ncbi:DUF4041 domain-containing protein [Selenomonas ruminantium]|uniref:DUF4041 domain-containing protein n=1 Tax=Selenomonas ruminantium TaxID=971 RepID=UPI0003F9FB06|nr:DUF4041 domain-containing protein [Selenomonas ruminantium]